jgi:hypothetical protein
MSVIRRTFALVIMVATASNAAEPIDIGTRLEPLVDDYLIDSLNNAKQTLHEPVRREVAIVSDSPWEGNTTGYHTVFQDGNRYRMYYRGWNLDGKTCEFSHEYVCYAESKDGIRWTKPNLGLYEFHGSKRNNIVWAGPEGTHAFAPFKDPNPACKPEQQYKAVGPIMGTPQKMGGLGAFQSPDGIHWSPMQEKPVITKGAFDSLNLAFWDATRQRYVEFHRDLRDGRRAVLTSTSTDFIHWTDPAWLEYPGVAKEELYTNAVIPYMRAPHIYLGFPMRYVASRSSQSMEGVPKVTGFRDVKLSDLGITDATFMTSRDGRNFHRWPEAFIRPGLSSDCWITRNNAPAWGVVQTKSDTAERIPELSIYASESYFNKATRLRRFSLRMDGFVSIHADSQGGEMVTKPIVFSGKRLEMNFSTSAAGLIQVEIQDASGKPIPGFTLEDCPEIFGDRIRQVVAWKQGNDLSKLAGKPVRLRFVLKDADLYAIQFP